MDNVNFAKLYKKSKKFYSHLPYIKQKKHINFTFSALRYFSYFILFLVIGVLIFSIYTAFKLKVVYNEISLGKSNLESAVYTAKNKNFQESAKLSEEASDNFKKAIDQLSNYQDNPIVGNFNYLNSQINDVNYILSAGENLSSLVNKIAGLAVSADEILQSNGQSSFTSLKKDDKMKILEYIHQCAPELAGIDANLKLAILNFKKIKYQGPLYILKPRIENFSNQLVAVEDALAKAAPFSELLPHLLGYPGKSTFLIILENSDELRATGGFIGTYGILETQDGDIARFDTHDIYHMDMPVKDKINETPPDPIKKYMVDKWYMRDANWSPDWPTSAEKIQYFFYKEDKLLPPKDQINNFAGKFDGVIAFTPEFVTDLLAVYGPITVDKEQYNKDNFVNLLQYKVEKGYMQLGVPSWQRKETVGKILEQLKLVYLNQSFTDIYKNINIFTDNLEKKNILIYFNDPNFQKISQNQNWSGEVKETKNDYIMIVDSNMASLKTDAVMRRNINYKVVQENKALFARLNINYSHNGKFDWKTTRYRTYTRIYLPQDSRIIKTNGFTDEKIDIYNELGKTVVGGFLSIEPGKIGNIYIDYQLPNSIYTQLKNNNYDLYIQKQPGSIVELLTVDVMLQNDIKSFQPTGFNVNKNEDNHIFWESDFRTDKIYSLTTY